MIALAIHKKLQSAVGEMNLQLDLTIEKGQLLTIYGPSGAGKTSILRILAGLLSADEGRIIVDGVTWMDSSKNIDIAPQKRKVGFVFQDYALFPNMTVKDNLRFALLNGQNPTIVDELLQMMELDGLDRQMPAKLSGGQKQRVALARALVQGPQLLLLDEPLSALDNLIREKLQNYLLKVHQDFGLTTILVSHDESEILKMSDKVIHLDQGKIIAQGSPSDVLPQVQAIQLTGELLAIEKGNMSVKIGTDIICIPVNAELATTFSVGDRVEVSSTLVHPSIRKLST